MMTGYETFTTYQALKLHFTQDSFDYFKYNGKSNVSINTFENRKDKYHFYKLSRRFNNKDDLMSFIVSNFVENENTWVGDLLQEQSETNHKKHLKVLQSFSYIFENDCRTVFDNVENPNDVIKVVDGDYPILLRKSLQKDIEIESLCLLAQILGFLPMWDKKITDTIRWPEYRRKIVKYTAFLPKDIVKYKLVLKKVIGK